MLKRLFTSNTRIKLLKTFLTNPDQEYFIRELTRMLDEQINSVRRELDNLKKLGLLRSKSKNRKKFYYLNKDFILFPELSSIIAKALSSEKRVAQDIDEIGEVKMLVLSGIFTNNDPNPVDMLIVGSIDRSKLTNYLNIHLSTKRPVKFAVLTEQDYKYRIDCKDKFINDIVENKQNFIPIKRI